MFCLLSEVRLITERNQKVGFPASVVSSEVRLLWKVIRELNSQRPLGMTENNELRMPYEEFSGKMALLYESECAVKVQ